jgi:hypothetical protein
VSGKKTTRRASAFLTRADVLRAWLGGPTMCGSMSRHAISQRRTTYRRPDFQTTSRQCWRGCRRGARTDAVVRLWTLKEALARAAGRGLSLPFGDIGFSIDPPRPVSAPPACQGRWRFAQWRPTRAHMLSAAVRCKGRQPIEIAFERVARRAGGERAQEPEDLSACHLWKSRVEAALRPSRPFAC